MKCASMAPWQQARRKRLRKHKSNLLFDAVACSPQVLLIMDEVVMGMGRTGKWFGYQQFGIRPDIVCMAKGVASGYAAIACVATTEEVPK